MFLAVKKEMFLAIQRGNVSSGKVEIVKRVFLVLKEEIFQIVKGNISSTSSKKKMFLMMDMFKDEMFLEIFLIVKRFKYF